VRLVASRHRQSHKKLGTIIVHAKFRSEGFKRSRYVSYTPFPLPSPPLFFNSVSFPPFPCQVAFMSFPSNLARGPIGSAAGIGGARLLNTFWRIVRSKLRNNTFRGVKCTKTLFVENLVKQKDRQIYMPQYSTGL